MPQLSFKVPNEWDGCKLNDFLRQHIKLSGTTIKTAKTIENGITMDGVHIRTVDIIRGGAVVKVIVDAAEREYKPCDIPVNLLYCDEDVVVADKPAGLPCHPSRGHPYDSLANALAARPELEGRVFRPIGRLDKDTSGAVVCALHAHSAYYLTENRPQKLYLAIISPAPIENEGIVEAPIARQSEDSLKRCVTLQGQYALTRYRILLKGSNCALALCKIETGRTHQIRVHMSHIGSPLIGDKLYGGDCSEINRQALHCFAVSFKGNAEGTEKIVLSPMPEDMKSYLVNHFGIESVEETLNKLKPIW